MDQTNTLLYAVHRSGIAILHTDTEFVILGATRGVTDSTGLEPGDLMGRRFFDIFSCSPWIPGQEGQVTGPERKGECVYIKGESHLRFIYRINEISPGKTPSPGLAVLLEKTTEEEFLLDKAVETAIKSSLLISVARHDVQNHITALLGYLELALDDVSDPGNPITGFLERCLQAAESIRKEIAYTREFKELGVSRPGWEDINRIIDNSLMDRELGQLKVIRDQGRYSLCTDLTFQKILEAFIDNTLTHAKGSTCIRFFSREESDTLIVGYEDDGPGIPQEKKKFLFEGKSGLQHGLPLSVARDILGISGFGLQETGEPGKGVRLEIRIPPTSYRHE